MRIIAGTARGIRLAPVPAGTRPVSDRAREGLFSSLAAHVVGAAVLDLFAGTGALGAEALSRDAARATFVDESPQAIRTILDNLDRTALAERATVLRSPVRRFLEHPSGGPYDLVLADPPYATESSEIGGLLTLMTGPGILAPGAVVGLTRAKRSSIDVIPVDLLVAKTLEYGDTLVHLIREDSRARERGVSGDV